MGNNRKYFLAMTKFQEFWRKADKTIFLGEWCKPSETKTTWEKLDYEVVDPPLVDKDTLGVYADIDIIYADLFPQIVTWFNKVHKKNYSEKYWEVLIGPWLYLHIQVVYDRYHRLKNAFDMCEDTTTVGLSESSFYTPINYNEYLSLVYRNNTFNFQLCSQIASSCFLKDLISAQLNGWTTKRKEKRSKHFNFIKRKLSSRVLITLMWLVVFLKRGNVVSMQGLGNNDAKFLLKLLIKSKFKIVPLDVRYYKNIDKDISNILDTPIDIIKRKSILALSEKTGVYQAILHTLIYSIPLSLIENYEKERLVTKKLFPFYTKVCVGFPVLTESIQHIWRASYVDRGALNVAQQHGGGYCTLNWHGFEYIERKFSDYFAQNVRSNDNRSIALPVLSNAYKKLKIPENKNISILWPVTAPARFPMVPQETAANHKLETVYYDGQERFLNALTNDVFDRLLMRLRHTDNTDFWKDLVKKFNKLKTCQFTDRSSYISQLVNSSLAIFDALGTVYLPALCLNIPTILFWNRELFDIHDEVKIYFKRLEDVGIYHSTPESAANKVNAIYKNPEKWWFNDDVQLARKQFCDHFMFIDKSTNIWIDKLTPLLEKS